MKKLLTAAAGALALSSAAYAQNQSGNADDATPADKPAAAATTSAQSPEQAMENAAQTARNGTANAKDDLQQAGETIGDVAKNAGETVSANVKQTAQDATPPFTSEEADAIAKLVNVTSYPVVRIGDYAVLGGRAVAADRLIGEDVYSGDDKKIATVKDAVIGADGKMKSLILSRGGFFGLNARDVEIAYNRFKPSTDDRGEPRLMIDATKDELSDVSEYKRSQASEGEIFVSDLLGEDVDFADATASAMKNAESAASHSSTEPDNAQQAANHPADEKTNDLAQSARLRDLIIGRNGEAQYAIVGYNGVLGMAQQLALIPYDRVRVAQGGEGVYLDLAAADLASAPAFAYSIDEAMGDTNMDNKARTGRPVKAGGDNPELLNQKEIENKDNLSTKQLNENAGIQPVPDNPKEPQ